MMSPQHWLTYRARDGIVETHLDPDEFALYAFFDRALELATAQEDPEFREFRLLDTFLSARADYHLLERVMLAAIKSGEPVRLLLANPFEPFAAARADSIGGIALHRTLSGLRNVAEAVFNARDARLPDLEKLDLAQTLQVVRDKTGKLTLEIRFYNAFPSGPMYFLRDLLLAGRFGAIRSAFRNPWWLIVNDRSHDSDLYDVSAAEFEGIWHSAAEDPASGVREPRLKAPLKQSAALKIIEDVWSRFHLVASQVASLGSQLKLTQERNVQVLLAALLRVHFEGLLLEEATPSSAGRGGRIDLLLPEHAVGIEVKLARTARDTGRIGSELILARSRYGKHPDCNVLACLIFDPDYVIKNRSTLKHDIEEYGDLETYVFFTPP